MSELKGDYYSNMKKIISNDALSNYTVIQDLRINFLSYISRSLKDAIPELFAL